MISQRRINQSISTFFIDYIWELVPAYITVHYYKTSSCAEGGRGSVLRPVLGVCVC